MNTTINNLTEQYTNLTEATPTSSPKLAFIPVNAHYWLINRDGGMYTINFVDCKMPFDFQKQGKTTFASLRVTKKNNNQLIYSMSSIENFFKSLTSLKGPSLLVSLKDYTYIPAMRIKGEYDPIIKMTLVKNDKYVFESYNKRGSFITFNEAFDDHKTSAYSGSIVLHGIWVNSESKTFGLTVHLKNVVLLD